MGRREGPDPPDLLPILSPLRPVLRCGIGGTNSYDCPLPALADKCQGTEGVTNYAYSTDDDDGPWLECVATPPTLPPPSPSTPPPSAPPPLTCGPGTEENAESGQCEIVCASTRPAGTSRRALEDSSTEQPSSAKSVFEAFLMQHPHATSKENQDFRQPTSA